MADPRYNLLYFMLTAAYFVLEYSYMLVPCLAKSLISEAQTPVNERERRNMVNVLFSGL